MSRRQLTPKQEAFAQSVAGGLNQSDAYRLAYEAEGMAPATVWNNSHVLAKHNEVAARIKELRDASAAHRIWTRDVLIAELAMNLENARRDRKFSAANRALWQIGKVTGLV